jgi:hypothetical protein
VFSQGDRDCPTTASKVVGTAGRDKPCSAVAATGQNSRSPADAPEIYNWFTEGFDTKDLQGAKALLEELLSNP